MEDTTKSLLEIFLAFAGARLLGWMFQSVKQPAIIGELLAGAILGPALLGLVHQSEFLEALGELGVILLLFTAGLDTHLEQLASARRRRPRWPCSAPRCRSPPASPAASPSSTPSARACSWGPRSWRPRSGSPCACSATWGTSAAGP